MVKNSCITLVFMLCVICGDCLGQSIRKSEVVFKGQKLTVCYIDLNKVNLSMYWKDSNGNQLRSLGQLKKYTASQKKKLLFATNGGMYLLNRDPQGLYIENGKKLVENNLKDSNYGNFYLKPNGYFVIREGKAEVFSSFEQEKLTDGIQYATQSGPMLVVDNQIHSSFKEGSTSKFTRSGVGVISDKQLVFVLSIDPINFFDFAQFFKEELKCRNALYLDGAISRMFFDSDSKSDLGGNFGCMIGVTM